MTATLALTTSLKQGSTLAPPSVSSSSSSASSAPLAPRPASPVDRTSQIAGTSGIGGSMASPGPISSSAPSSSLSSVSSSSSSLSSESVDKLSRLFAQFLEVRLKAQSSGDSHKRALVEPIDKELSDYLESAIRKLNPSLPIVDPRLTNVEKDNEFLSSLTLALDDKDPEAAFVGVAAALEILLKFTLKQAVDESLSLSEVKAKWDQSILINKESIKTRFGADTDRRLADLNVLFALLCFKNQDCFVNPFQFVSKEKAKQQILSMLISPLELLAHLDTKLTSIYEQVRNDPTNMPLRTSAETLRKQASFVAECFSEPIQNHSTFVGCGRHLANLLMILEGI